MGKPELTEELRLDRKELRTEIGRRVRTHLSQVRDELGMNNYQIAQRCGIDPSTLSKFAAGEAREIGIEVLFKLSVGMQIAAQHWLSKNPIPRGALGLSEGDLPLRPAAHRAGPTR